MPLMSNVRPLMNTAAQSEAVWLKSLEAAERARFLAALSHNLTVAVRVLCRSGVNAEQGLEWVRLLNEAHHRVASYLSHHHAGNEDTAWVPVVVEFVLGSNDPVVLQQAQQAWSFAKEGVSGVPAA